MWRWHWLALLVGLAALAGVGGCIPAPSPAPPTFTPVSSGPTETPRLPSPSAPATAALPPSSTPAATQPPAQAATTEPAATRTPTASAGLPAKGPYLAYTKDGDRQITLVIAGADGAGRKEFALPADDFLADLSRRISPNGEWMAYYSGTADQSGSARGPNDLTLNLLRLSDGQTQTVAALLSPDYPRNFDVNAAALSKIDPKQFPPDGQLPGNLWDAFSNGIHSLAWSPDGGRLAFSGEMDGPSSDLYLYDLDTRAIHRLTDGLGEIQDISWSPDGKWILNTSAYWVGEGSPVDSFVAAADGSGVTPVGGGQYMGGWLSPSEMLRYSSANGIGNYDLQKVDVETGLVTEWWPKPFGSYALDRTRNLLALSSSGPQSGEEALYLVDLATGESKQIAATASWQVGQVADPGYPFWATNYAGTLTLAIAADGATRVVSDAYSGLAVSGDKQRVGLYEPGLALYTSDGKLAWSADLPVSKLARVDWSPDSKGLALRNEPGLVYVPAAGGEPLTLTTQLTADAITWRPDSAGLFFTSGTDLYYWALGAAQPTLVDQNVTKYFFDRRAAWIESLGPAAKP
jgi:hypothetical protein